MAYDDDKPIGDEDAELDSEGDVLSLDDEEDEDEEEENLEDFGLHVEGEEEETL